MQWLVPIDVTPAHDAAAEVADEAVSTFFKTILGKGATHDGRKFLRAATGEELSAPAVVE